MSVENLKNLLHTEELMKKLTPEEFNLIADKIRSDMTPYIQSMQQKAPQQHMQQQPKPLYLEPFFDSNYTDKNSIHSYLPVYEQLLQPFITNKTAFNMLEIGIQRGGSILAWCKAFPNASVIGVDCQKTVSINLPNFKECITNAYTEEFLELIPANSQDFIVEDGSHAYQDMLFACRHYPSLLKKGGVLVIEDVPDVNWLPKMRALATSQGCITQVLDLREKKKRWDDVMLLIKKP
jgi:predicted O-methyltransferase YrrM